jgi:hypothetical protein
MHFFLSAIGVFKRLLFFPCLKLGDVAVNQACLWLFALDKIINLSGNNHGAMPAAGASNTDGQIGFAFLFV